MDGWSERGPGWSKQYKLPQTLGSNARPSWCEVVSLLGGALMCAEKLGRFGLSTPFIVGVPSGLPVANTF